MKTIAVLCFLALITFQSIAQDDPQKLQYVIKAEKYRKMKSTGATLTVTGGILFVAGFVTLLNSSIETTYSGGGQGQTTTQGNPVAGAAALFLGTAGLGAGIPLWIIGGHNQRKYDMKVQSLSAKFGVNQRSAGVTLSLKF